MEEKVLFVEDFVIIQIEKIRLSKAPKPTSRARL